MKQILAAVLALTLLSGSADAQGRGQGRGQGARMNAPTAQGAPVQRGPSLGQMRGAGPVVHHAVPRPPMHPAYRPNYAPRSHYGYGPRGYAPYSGAYYGYRPYGYRPYYPYYPNIGIGIYPGGWTVGGVYGGVSVYYEKQTVVQESPSSRVVESGGSAFVLFEVDAVEAEVYVNGAYEGVVEHFLSTPLRLPVGEHHVELRLGGERVSAFTLRLTLSQTVKIRATLLR